MCVHACVRACPCTCVSVCYLCFGYVCICACVCVHVRVHYARVTMCINLHVCVLSAVNMYRLANSNYRISRLIGESNIWRIGQ